MSNPPFPFITVEYSTLFSYLEFLTVNKTKAIKMYSCNVTDKNEKSYFYYQHSNW